MHSTTTSTTYETESHKIYIIILIFSTVSNHYIIHSCSLILFCRCFSFHEVSLLPSNYTQKSTSVSRRQYFILLMKGVCPSLCASSLFFISSTWRWLMTPLTPLYAVLCCMYLFFPGHSYQKEKKKEQTCHTILPLRGTHYRKR